MEIQQYYQLGRLDMYSLFGDCWLISKAGLEDILIYALPAIDPPQ